MPPRASLRWACFPRVLYPCECLGVYIQSPFQGLSWPAFCPRRGDGGGALHPVMHMLERYRAALLYALSQYSLIRPLSFYNGHGRNHFYKNQNKSSEVFGITPVQAA